MVVDGRDRLGTWAARLRRAGRAIRVVHPVPSLIVAGGTAVVATTAGASLAQASLLALAMLAFQGSIGALNDVMDADTDGLVASKKPIAAGIVSKRSAAIVAGVGAALGTAISAAFGPAVAVLGVAGWGCGAAYDIRLRRMGLGWLAFALALPLLLAWTWTATTSFPPGWPGLLLAAAIAGPMVHLANSLVDIEIDAQTGRRTLATALGRRRAGITLAALASLVLGLAAVAGATHGELPVLGDTGFFVGAALAVVGVVLAWTPSPRLREVGWLLLASSLVLVAAAWLTS